MSNSTTIPVDIDFPITMIVINAFSGFLATVLNLLIIFTFLKTPFLRTHPSNILILGLAITDFGVGAVVQPVHCRWIFAIMNCNKYAIENAKKVSEFSCNILIVASLLTITVITVDRFLALYLHLRYQELATTKMTSAVLVIIWIISVSWALSFLTLEEVNITALTITSSIIFLSLMLINVALMIKISCIVDEHAEQIQAQQQFINAQPGVAVNIKRSVNIMYYILGIFVLCYLPANCVWIMKGYLPKDTISAVHEVVRAILMLNSSINPIIYFWRIHDMRNAAFKLFRCIRRNNNDNNKSNGAKKGNYTDSSKKEMIQMKTATKTTTKTTTATTAIENVSDGNEKDSINNHTDKDEHYLEQRHL